MTQTDDAPERIAHPFNGPDLPTEVFADPGRRGWYFREKMPDSVARFVRADLAPTPQDDARVVALVEALRFCAAEPEPYALAVDIIKARMSVASAALAAFDKGGKADE